MPCADLREAALDRGGRLRRVRERCIIMADLCYCTAVTNTKFWSNFPSVKKYSWKSLYVFEVKIMQYSWPSLIMVVTLCVGFPGGTSGKEPTCQFSRYEIPGLGRSLGGLHGNSLQYSCLEGPMNSWAWQATVHSVAKSRTWLKRLSTCTWPA